MKWNPGKWSTATSNRVITKDQFSDGTTVDGSRIEKALQESADVINSLPIRFLNGKNTPTTFHGSWRPHWTADAVDAKSTFMHRRESPPYMPLYNELLYSGTPPLTALPLTEGPFNAVRIKGIEVEDLAPTEMLGFLVWETSFPFFRPVILDALAISLQCDGKEDPPPAIVLYTNGFYYNIALEYIAQFTQARDLHIVIHVDNPYATEESAYDANEIMYRNFVINAWHMASVAPANTYIDMLPDAPQGYPGGAVMVARDLKIPIHQNARVRLAIVLPVYKDGIAASTWTGLPVTQVIHGFTMTVLEELEKGPGING